jgi:hypothetical protein
MGARARPFRDSALEPPSELGRLVRGEHPADRRRRYQVLGTLLELVAFHKVGAPPDVLDGGSRSRYRAVAVTH